MVHQVAREHTLAAPTNSYPTAQPTTLIASLHRLTRLVDDVTVIRRLETPFLSVRQRGHGGSGGALGRWSRWCQRVINGLVTSQANGSRMMECVEHWSSTE